MDAIMAKAITIRLDKQTKKRIKRLKGWLKRPESEILGQAIDRLYFRESCLRAYARPGSLLGDEDTSKRRKGRLGKRTN